MIEMNVKRERKKGTLFFKETVTHILAFLKFSVHNVMDLRYM